MKRVIRVYLAGIAVLAMAAVFGCNSDSSSAIKYNDSIIDHQNKVVNKMMELVKTFETRDHAVMTGKLSELNAELDQSIAAVSAMEGFKGDTSLRDAIVELMTFYKGIFSNEYKEMIDIIGAETPPSADDIARMQTIQKNVSVREKVLDDKLAQVQQAFAEKYNIKIKKNELQKKIDNL